VHPDDALHQVALGELDEWKTQRRRKASGSSFSALEVITTTGRSRATISSPVSLTTKRIRSSSWSRSLGFQVGLVHLVDQEDHAIVGGEGPVPAAVLDVAADVLDVSVPETGVVKALHGVVDVEASCARVVDLTGQWRETQAEPAGDGLRELRLPRPGLSADEERSLQRQPRQFTPIPARTR